MIESAMSNTMMEKVIASNWSEGSEKDELLRELFDDESPLLMLPEETITNISDSSKEQAFNKFISNIYSGPTILDIENALSVTNHREHFPQLSSTR